MAQTSAKSTGSRIVKAASPAKSALKATAGRSAARKPTAVKATIRRPGRALKPAGKRSGAISDEVVITHPEKILFSSDKISKGQLAEYYKKVAPLMLADVQGRPLMLMRCPQGDRGACFFQKHAQSARIRVGTVTVKEDDGAKEKYFVIKEEREIVELVQQNVIEFHTWGSREPKIESPDRLIFDLDPSEEVSSGAVVAMAIRLRDFLKKFRLVSYPRLSGGKGIHLVVPIATGPTWDQVRHTSEALAALFAKNEPKVTIELSKKKRVGRVFVDYLRNGRGATCVCNYSVRSRKHAPIAVPVSWDEISSKTVFNKVTIDNFAVYQKRAKPNPWKGYGQKKQTLPQV